MLIGAGESPNFISLGYILVISIIGVQTRDQQEGRVCAPLMVSKFNAWLKITRAMWQLAHMLKAAQALIYLAWKPVGCLQ